MVGQLRFYIVILKRDILSILYGIVVQENAFSDMKEDPFHPMTQVNT